ncbi:gephyrin-like molybdotransferase Glp [Candidatus Poribacteria bacterium]
MIDVNDALEAMLAHTPRLPTETLPLSEALHSVTAETIIAHEDNPSFDSSAMDGYGVKVNDVQTASDENPVELKIAGVVKAGQVYKKSLEPGTAVKIFTGAMVPEGVEAVLMREKSSEADGKVLIKSSVEPGENIRRRGGQFKQGDEALPAGVPITPPVIGLLAALGYAEICVYRKPKVAVVITGDELLEPQDPLEDGKIRDVNTYTIQAALQEMGIKAISFKRAIDDPENLREAVSQSLSSADILIVSGGISVGDYDFAKDVFEGVGVNEVFWRVAVKPGKPTFFGTKDEKLVFGLPGNPASALVIFYLFVRRAIFSMMGREETQSICLPAIMKSEVRKEAGRREYLRGRFQCENDKLYAELHGRQFSHMMSSFANSNCLIIFPKEETNIAEDEEVQIQLLPWTAL